MQGKFIDDGFESEDAFAAFQLRMFRKLMENLMAANGGPAMYVRWVSEQQRTEATFKAELSAELENRTRVITRSPLQRKEFALAKVRDGEPFYDEDGVYYGEDMWFCMLCWTANSEDAEYCRGIEKERGLGPVGCLGKRAQDYLMLSGASLFNDPMPRNRSARPPTDDSATSASSAGSSQGAPGPGGPRPSNGPREQEGERLAKRARKNAAKKELAENTGWPCYHCVLRWPEREELTWTFRNIEFCYQCKGPRVIDEVQYDTTVVALEQRGDPALTERWKSVYEQAQAVVSAPEADQERQVAEIGPTNWCPGIWRCLDCNMANHPDTPPASCIGCDPDDARPKSRRETLNLVSLEEYKYEQQVLWQYQSNGWLGHATTANFRKYIKDQGQAKVLKVHARYGSLEGRYRGHVKCPQCDKWMHEAQNTEERLCPDCSGLVYPSIGRSMEKLLVNCFPDVIPEAWITRDQDRRGTGPKGIAPAPRRERTPSPSTDGGEGQDPGDRSTVVGDEPDVSMRIPSGLAWSP